MKIDIYDGIWTIDYVKNNQNKIFVFGDNNLRSGKGGQAIIRDLPNAIGLRTKRGPSNKPVAFYSDDEFDKNISNIREDILDIKKNILFGKNIVFSKNGYGTGLAQLEKVAPKTYFKFCQLLLGHFGFDNISGSIRRRIPGYDEIISGTYVSIDNKKFESNVLTPINNSFFRSDYLSNNINSIYDLIIKGKKIAFTYPINHNLGDILILSVGDSKNYLVCRVVDSYEHDSISKELWSLFEGFDVSYIDQLRLTNNQKLYQNHIDFVCTLDESGKMEFNKSLFGNVVEKKEIDKKEFNKKIIGETTSPVFDIVIPDGLKKILNKKGINGVIQKFPNSEEKSTFYKKEKYQIKVEDIYYAVEYINYPIWDSVNILLTSKNSFI